MCVRVSTYTYVCVQLSIYTCVYKSHMSLAERHHTFSRENKLVHSICSLPWNNNLAQCIFDPAAMECLCISSNYLRATLRCKRSIRNHCKQAVQHCRLQPNEASTMRHKCLSSSSGLPMARHPCNNPRKSFGRGKLLLLSQRVKLLLQFIQFILTIQSCITGF